MEEILNSLNPRTVFFFSFCNVLRPVYLTINERMVEINLSDYGLSGGNRLSEGMTNNCRISSSARRLDKFCLL